MSGKSFPVGQLEALLERFPLPRAGSRPAEEMIEAHVQHLLERVAHMTDALGDAERNGAAQLASRLLLEDLAVIAAHFRGRANTMGQALSKVLVGLRDACHEASESERR